MWQTNDSRTKKTPIKLSATTILQVWVVTRTQSFSNKMLAKQNVLNCDYSTIADLSFKKANQVKQVGGHILLIKQLRFYIVLIY